MSKIEVIDGIPQSKGVPAVKIMTSCEEKIGLPHYSNIVVGPISVSRYVEDGDDEHILQEIKNTARIVERFIAEEREVVLKMVQEKT